MCAGSGKVGLIARRKGFGLVKKACKNCRGGGKLSFDQTSSCKWKMDGIHRYSGAYMSIQQTVMDLQTTQALAGAVRMRIATGGIESEFVFKDTVAAIAVLTNVLPGQPPVPSAIKRGQYWEIEMDSGWSPWNPGQPFRGEANEQIVFQLGHTEAGQTKYTSYRVFFHTDTSGVQENLETRRSRPIRRVFADSLHPVVVGGPGMPYLTAVPGQGAPMLPPAAGMSALSHPQASGAPRCNKPGCGKPTWNGLPNGCCSKACRDRSAGPSLCNRPGCGKPTWNGLANGCCSKACRDGPAGPSLCNQFGAQAQLFQLNQHVPAPNAFALIAPSNGQANPASSVPPCLRPGCGKPPWDGQPNSYCSKDCLALFFSSPRSRPPT